MHLIRHLGHPTQRVCNILAFAILFVQYTTVQLFMPKDSLIFCIASASMFVLYMIANFLNNNTCTELVIVGQTVVIIPLIVVVVVDTIRLLEELISTQQGFSTGPYSSALSIYALLLVIINIVMTLAYLFGLRKMTTLQMLENDGDYKLLLKENSERLECMCESEDETEKQEPKGSTSAK